MPKWTIKRYVYLALHYGNLDSASDIIKIDATRRLIPAIEKSRGYQIISIDCYELFDTPEFGKLYKTEVRLPYPEELTKFKNLENGKEALFVLARIWDDTEYCKKIRKSIAKGQYKKYSITGNILEARACTREEYCGRLVSELNLSAVTICNAGANPAAEFDIIKRDDKMAEEKPIEKIEEKAPVPEFLTKADFEAYKGETFAKINELIELMKKQFEKKEEDPKIEKEAKKPEEKPEGIVVDMKKMKEEVKAELKEEFTAVQKSHAVEEKAPTADDLAATLAKIELR